jgi:tetratricopeptide (TPR) repeat protein
MLFEAEGREADAQATYEHLLARDGRAGVAANNLACLYVRRGRFDDALRYALVAREELHDLPQASDTLGWVYYQLRQLNEALPLLSESVDRQRDNPVYRFHLGMAYAATGAMSQARRELSQALAGTRAFPERDAAAKALANLNGTASSELQPHSSSR